MGLEAKMDELKWDFLTEVQGRGQADLLKSYFAASGIDVELFQESLGQHIYPTSLDILGNVQIYVPKEQLTAARELLIEYYHPQRVAPEELEKPVVRKTRSTLKKTAKEKAQKPVARKTQGTPKKTTKPAVPKSAKRKSR